jgi:hypothetical protein
MAKELINPEKREYYDLLKRSGLLTPGCNFFKIWLVIGVGGKGMPLKVKGK